MFTLIVVIGLPKMSPEWAGRRAWQYLAGLATSGEGHRYGLRICGQKNRRQRMPGQGRRGSSSETSSQQVTPGEEARRDGSRQMSGIPGWEDGRDKVNRKSWRAV